MYIIKLIGGLGNQMFQYAAAYVEAKNNNQILKIDNLYYRDKSKRLHRFEYRPYALSLFDNLQIATPKEINRFVLPRIFNKYIYHTLKYLHRDRFVYDETQLNTYDKLINIPTQDAYITGFFQKYEYIENNICELKQIYRFKDELPNSHLGIASEIKKQENAVCIVFRRGDYVNHPTLGIIGLDFYYKALEILRSKISNPVFFIFSDDIPWCKANFRTDGKVVFVDQKYTGAFAGNYLQLMMLCSHFIIPNSTYPYWAALLSEHNLQKLVIAPKVWYKGQDYDRNNILPPEWLAI